MSAPPEVTALDSPLVELAEDISSFPGVHSPDFISTYADYADVLEALRDIHEVVGISVLAATLNPRVRIQYGGLESTLDVWVLILSASGLGRNTIVGLARPVVDAVDLDLIRNSTWGSAPAFYQDIAKHPSGLYVWPEMSVVLKKLAQPQFSGVKEWITDRYDNLTVPQGIRYRVTGKKSDTPPIQFSEAPRLNILATSSFDWFVANLEQEDTTGGFVPRWLLVCPTDPAKVISKPREPDLRLIEPLAGHLSKAAKLEGEADFASVEDIYDAWYRNAHERFHRQANPGLAVPFFNRIRTHVLKLAVIYEVSQSCSIKVSPQAMHRAIQTATRVEETIFRLLPTGLTREGSEVDKIQTLIRGAGDSGIPLSELTYATKHMRAQDRHSRMMTLTDSGEVRRFSRPTSGRTAKILVHQDHLEAHAAQFPDDKERI